jgi:hypothetical protein
MVSNSQDPLLDAELAAMQQIAAIVGGLDAATRARVLRWAAERYMAHAPAGVSAAHLPGDTPAEMPDASDETLSVSALDDFFDRREATHPREQAAAPATGMLHEFVAEFQDMVREWNVAVGAPADVRPGRSADIKLKTAS